MNILVITQYFWPENFRINDLAQGFQEKNHRVTVLTGIPNYPTGSYFTGYGLFKRRVENFRGIKVVRVPLIPRGAGGGLRLALNYISFAFFACVLAPFKRLGPFDLIFVYEPSPITVGLPALVLKKITSKPIIFWVQDLWPESLSATGAVHSKIILSIVRRLVRFIYHGCDLILVQSKAFIPPIECLGVSTGRMSYFPNSAEELYQPMELEANAAERIGFPKGFCIMFAGNMGVAQDFPTILDAASRLKAYTDIHWIILGDGRVEPWVREQVIARGLTNTVHLLGRHPASAMPRYFSLADVLLVTLKKNPIFAYTIPAKIQSYLACAKPIIAALDGEGANVVKEAGAGFTCSSESPIALSDAVLTLYKMPASERRSMGEKGRRYFENHFERTILMARLERIIQSFKVEG